MGIPMLLLLPRLLSSSPPPPPPPPRIAGLSRRRPAQMARRLILEAATGHQSFQSRRSHRCIVLVDAPFPVKKILSIAKGFPTLPFFTKCTSPVLLRGCCKLLTRWECQNISTAFFFFPQTYYSKYDFMKAVHLQQSCTQIEKGTVDFLK